MRIFPRAYNIHNLVIKNNIFTGTGYYEIYFQYTRSTEVSGRITLSNNLYYRTTGTEHNRWYNGDNKYWGTNYIIKNPLLTSILHLSYNSPSINKGTTVSLTTDFDGDTRRGICDIGADEYV